MQKKVIIFDNDREVLDVMQEVLIYGGFEVKVIRDTDNIFPLLHEYKPDILLLDYMLDGINGDEVCHQIKSNVATSNIRVVLMSAYPIKPQSLGHANCDAFIPKPFDLYELLDKVNELVDNAPGNTAN
jgi:DNA-binding response OmpR family regulator